MSPGKLKEEKDAFIADYLQMNNDGGVIATDQKMEYTPIRKQTGYFRCRPGSAGTRKNL